MTVIRVSADSITDFFVHVYGYGTDTDTQKYPQSGQPIDCIVMEGSGNNTLRICSSAAYKRVMVVNNSEYPKRVVINHDSSSTCTIDGWGFKIFVTGGYSKASPRYVNKLFSFNN